MQWFTFVNNLITLSAVWSGQNLPYALSVMNSAKGAVEVGLVRVVRRVTLFFKVSTNSTQPWNDNLYHLIRALFSWHSSFILILFMHLDCFTI